MQTPSVICQATTAFRYILLLFCLCIFSTANAVTVPGVASTSSQTVPQLPETLTKDNVGQFLGTLSDKEVRVLLSTQLNNLAENSTATTKADVKKSIKQGLKQTKDLIWNSIKSSVNIGGIFSFLSEQFSIESYGQYFILKLLSLAFLVMFLAYIIESLIIKAIKKCLKVGEVKEHINHELSAKFINLLKIFVFRISGLLLFYWIAIEFIEELMDYELEKNISTVLLDYVFVARVAFLSCAFFLSPKHPQLRLFKITDKESRTLVNRLIIVCLLSSSDIFIEWLWDMGIQPGKYKLGFITHLLTYLSMIWVVWSSRNIITDMLLHTKGEISFARRKFALMWPKIVIFSIVFVWLIFHAILANGQFGEELIENLSVGATLTLITIISVPFFDVAILALVEHYYPTNELAEENSLLIRRSLQGSLIRIMRLLLLISALVIYPVLWGFSYADLASQGLGAKATAAIVEVASIIIVAYIIWEIVNALVKRQLMLEAPEDDAEADEGGQGLSRLATVLPILHITIYVFICVFSLFAVLTSMGFNTTPLLAGAGVLGLAVGFGAQTLVKDIVSGVFFLIDDAFRMGEYVDTGEIKGTVEKIALRSLRLRHHLGALHTIPYGEISRLTNYSRDWVIMKLRFRVPHDSDINKIKKLFKRLGQELLEHNELGDDFIEPFKSQGVLEVDEVGMVIRGKFTCKPGRQFMIRKEVYLQVQQIFANNGIEFARRKVEVQIPESAPENLKNQISAAASEAINQVDTTKAPTT